MHRKISNKGILLSIFTLTLIISLYSVFLSINSLSKRCDRYHLRNEILSQTGTTSPLKSNIINKIRSSDVTSSAESKISQEKISPTPRTKVPSKKYDIEDRKLSNQDNANKAVREEKSNIIDISLIKKSESKIMSSLESDFTVQIIATKNLTQIYRLISKYKLSSSALIYRARIKKQNLYILSLNFFSNRGAAKLYLTKLKLNGMNAWIKPIRTIKKQIEKYRRLNAINVNV
ncbi:SPOR domain-containing protein [Vibrio sp. S4M6]|uniref:SPOR domain-containing protein n=1 Tax=Vibrio sinus TaxID=2946865 RepID=UPI002029F231|nr:SPOR domain-containing protein [Vibrio sinus]MCL9783745.1 SPOR domain-containing protein [Vibrio sinus]